MTEKEFKALVGDPKGIMIFNLQNWEVDPNISVDTYHQILVNTMRMYIQGLKSKDDVLTAKCVAKFDELRQFNKLK